MPHVAARVSIVIPVYNGANYLGEAIDSALAQTYSDVEILVVNDGSTDGGATEAVARAYGGRIRYIAKPNGGVSSALNRGIAEMRGEWFCWLSHDDRFLPEKTARQIAFLDAHPDARVAHCDFDLIDENGRAYDVVRASRSAFRTGRDVLSEWIFGCALMIHRRCFDDTGPFNEANRTTQDLEMWLRLVEHHPIYNLAEVLAQVRQHPHQGSRTEARYGRDKDDLFSRVVQRYDVAFFDPAAVTPRQRAEVYDFVAINAMQRQSIGGANAAIRCAWREWPSLRNPAALRRLLGARGWLVWNNVKQKTLSKLRRVWRAVG